MDTTQINSISTVNNYIPIIALFVSICAIIISYIALKKTEKISAPKIVNESTRENDFVIHIQDYSIGKNLRIDRIYYKSLKSLRYHRINFIENRPPNQSPPIVEVLINHDKIPGFCIIKIKTNISKLYEVKRGILDSPSPRIKGFHIIQKFNYRKFKRA